MVLELPFRLSVSSILLFTTESRGSCLRNGSARLLSVFSSNFRWSFRQITSEVEVCDDGRLRNSAGI